MPKRQRPDLPIRYREPSQHHRQRKSECDIYGWMQAEGLTKESILADGNLAKDFYDEERGSPTFFIMDDILEGRPAPVANHNKDFIKKEDRGDGISYYKYFITCMHYELSLWYCLKADYPKKTTRYHRGHLSVKITKDDINPDEPYWVASGRE